MTHPNNTSDLSINETKIFSALLSEYIHAGAPVADPMTLIQAASPAEFRESLVATWVKAEMNLPRSIRSLCSGCFLRVMTTAQFAAGIVNNITFNFGERTYALHCQSHRDVLLSAPLIAVSFRCYQGQYYAVAHVWATKTADGRGF